MLSPRSWRGRSRARARRRRGSAPSTLHVEARLVDRRRSGTRRERVDVAPHSAAGSTCCVYASTTRRVPLRGMGKILSSALPPRCHSSSAGSRHGPGTHTISSTGLGALGAACWMTPRQMPAARVASTNSPSTSLPSTSSASRSRRASGGSGNRQTPSSSCSVVLTKVSSTSVRAIAPAMRALTSWRARRTAPSISSLLPGLRARSSPSPAGGRRRRRAPRSPRRTRCAAPRSPVAVISTRPPSAESSASSPACTVASSRGPSPPRRRARPRRSRAVVRGDREAPSADCSSSSELWRRRRRRRESATRDPLELDVAGAA